MSSTEAAPFQKPSLRERLLVAACRFYQRLFSSNHSDAEQLARVFHCNDRQIYFSEVFNFSRRKALERLASFQDYSDDWSRRSVLDFGCGSGGILCELSQRFQSVVGVDIASADVAFAQQQIARLGLSNADCVSYPGQELPFADGTFDAVVSIDVLEHVANLELSLTELFRVLKPRRRAYFSFGPLWKHPHGKHMWVELPGWWTHLLFPRSVVMQVRGANPQSSWQDLGLACLTASNFQRALATCAFCVLDCKYRSNPLFRPLMTVPIIREYFLSEIVCVLEKP